MTAEKLSKLDTFDCLSLVSIYGNVIYSYPIGIPVTNSLIISTEDYRLPSDPFYMRLEGKDNRKSFTKILKQFTKPMLT